MAAFGKAEPAFEEVPFKDTVLSVYRVTKDSPKWQKVAYDYVRCDAFVVGQSIPIEGEYQGDDDEDLEAVVLVEDHKPVAGSRLAYPGKGLGQIQRICVVREKQRTGIGHVLIQESEKWLLEKGIHHVLITSQDRAAGFYNRCGYETLPDEKLDEYFPEDAKRRKEHEKEKKKGGPLSFSIKLVEKYI